MLLPEKSNVYFEYQFTITWSVKHLKYFSRNLLSARVSLSHLLKEMQWFSKGRYWLATPPPLLKNKSPTKNMTYSYHVPRWGMYSKQEGSKLKPSPGCKTKQNALSSDSEFLHQLGLCCDPWLGFNMTGLTLCHACFYCGFIHNFVFNYPKITSWKTAHYCTCGHVVFIPKLTSLVSEYVISKQNES